jgi:hypothetical protein
MKPTHDGLRANVIGGSVSQYLREVYAPEGVSECRSRGLGSVPVAPGASMEAPSDLVVRADRMILCNRHDPAVAQEASRQRLDQPPPIAVVPKRVNVPLKLGVAEVARQWAAEVCHHDGVRIELREGVSVVFHPTPES